MKKFFKPKIKNLFESKILKKVKSIRFKYEEKHNCSGTIHFENGKAPFEVKYEDENNYQLHIYAYDKSDLQKEFIISSKIDNHPINIKVKELNNWNYNDFTIKAKYVPFSIVEKVKNKQSSIDFDCKIYIFSFLEKTVKSPCEIILSLNIKGNTISFDDNVANKFYYNPSLKPDYFIATGKQSLILNDESIDKIMDIIYKNHIYFMKYYGKYPLEAIKIENINEANYKVLNYLYYTEKSIKEMVSI